MKRTAIYIRVSSDKQVQEGDSIPAQRTALRKYIDDRPDLTFAGEYMDDGISGTKYSQRDELQRLLEDVKDGKVDLIIFTKLDRWFRSVRHYTATQEILDRAGTGWKAIWEPIYDTTTPQGRLIVNQMVSIGQYEAENTGQRIRQVQQYKITQGEVISGSTPAGYSIVNKHLVPNADAPFVRECFQDYANCGNLFATLGRWGGTHGIPRSKYAVKRMLMNPLYIGRHRYGVEGFCDPIVEMDLFEDVQRKLSMNIKKSQKRVYLFSGLIRCGECGKVFAAQRRIRKRGNYQEEERTYRCTHHYNFKPRLCDNAKQLSETTLEKYLLNSIADIMKDTVLSYEVEEAPQRDREKQLAAINRKIDRLKELYVNELISIDEYKQDKEALAQQAAELEAVPAPPKRAIEELERLMQMDIRGIYADLSVPERRMFWRGIIKVIWFDKERNIRVEML